MAPPLETAHPVSPTRSGHSKKRLLVLSLGSLGIVYGDIGTSPLYALRECFYGKHAIAPTHGNVLGVLSLILWSLLLIISVKYLILILRADNRGEGGILALATLVSDVVQRGKIFFLVGLFGAALLYADGMITPAISVMGAVEGLHIATPLFDSYVVTITIVILVALFLFQSRGTTGVGTVFGPVTLVWFVAIAALEFTKSGVHPRFWEQSTPYAASISFSTMAGMDSWSWERCSWLSPAAKPFMRTLAISARRRSD